MKLFRKRDKLQVSNVVFTVSNTAIVAQLLAKMVQTKVITNNNGTSQHHVSIGDTVISFQEPTNPSDKTEGICISIAVNDIKAAFKICTDHRILLNNKGIYFYDLDVDDDEYYFTIMCGINIEIVQRKNPAIIVDLDLFQYESLTNLIIQAGNSIPVIREQFTHKSHHISLSATFGNCIFRLKEPIGERFQIVAMNALFVIDIDCSIDDAHVQIQKRISDIGHSFKQTHIQRNANGYEYFTVTHNRITFVFRKA